VIPLALFDFPMAELERHVADRKNSDLGHVQAYPRESGRLTHQNHATLAAITPEASGEDASYQQTVSSSDSTDQQDGKTKTAMFPRLVLRCATRRRR